MCRERQWFLLKVRFLPIFENKGKYQHPLTRENPDYQVWKSYQQIFCSWVKIPKFFWLISTKTKLKAKFFFLGEKRGSGETLEGKEGFF